MAIPEGRSERSGGLSLWILVSVALHAALLLGIPYHRATKSFKIYPLANAGLIELGPSGGHLGGGPVKVPAKGTGGGGQAHYLNTAPKKHQVITKHVAPSPPQLGVKKGRTTAKPSVAKGKVTKGSEGASVVRTASAAPAGNSKASGAKTDPDVLTSSTATGTAIASSSEGQGSKPPQPSEGRASGTEAGSGNTTVQGALSGPGGLGKGPGGPGGTGESPIAGDGKSFVVNGAQPVYPKQAEEDHLEGPVGIRITVNSAGEPSDVKITQSSGFAVLDQITKRQIQTKWRFLPAGKGYILTLVVTFKDGTVDYTMDPVKPLV